MRPRVQNADEDGGGGLVPGAERVGVLDLVMVVNVTCWSTILKPLFVVFMSFPTAKVHVLARTASRGLFKVERGTRVGALVVSSPGTMRAQGHPLPVAAPLGLLCLCVSLRATKRLLLHAGSVCSNVLLRVGPM